MSVHHLLAELGVEGRGRLVEEHERGIVHERPADGHPLALAARELAGQVVAPVGQAQLVEQLIGPLPGGGPGPPAQLVDHQQVLAGGEERHQVHGLEHEADPVAAEPVEVPSPCSR